MFFYLTIMALYLELDLDSLRDSGRLSNLDIQMNMCEIHHVPYVAV